MKLNLKLYERGQSLRGKRTVSIYWKTGTLRFSVSAYRTYLKGKSFVELYSDVENGIIGILPKVKQTESSYEIRVGRQRGSPLVHVHSVYFVKSLGITENITAMLVEEGTDNDYPGMLIVKLKKRKE